MEILLSHARLGLRSKTQPIRQQVLLATITARSLHSLAALIALNPNSPKSLTAGSLRSLATLIALNPNSPQSLTARSLRSLANLIALNPNNTKSLTARSHPTHPKP